MDLQSYYIISNFVYIRTMSFLEKLKLSFRYGVGYFIVAAIPTLGALWALISNGPDGEGQFICGVLKLVSIPIVWYLYKTFDNKNTIYFFLNLGISRTEYYVIPIVIEYIFFRILFRLVIYVYPLIDAWINGGG